jgi:ADP-ribose pyrophosphatase YjhB (NUDIX family)
MEDENRPRVGVAIIVLKNGKILIGEDGRKGNVFGVPGGHWENHETLKDCAIREVKEESGIICEKPTLISVYDFYREDKGKSYVTIGMKCDFISGEPTDLVSEKRFNWSWHNPEDALRLNLFSADKILIQRYLSGEIYK